MIYYGLDLSLVSTGITIFQNNNHILTTTIKTDAAESSGKRLHEIYQKLNNFKIFYNPDKVYIENGFCRFNASTQALYEVRGITELVFWDVDLEFIAPATIKKFITGSGRSSKEELQARLKSEYGKVFNNFDESDSYGVILCGMGNSSF